MYESVCNQRKADESAIRWNKLCLSQMVMIVPIIASLTMMLMATIAPLKLMAMIAFLVLGP